VTATVGELALESSSSRIRPCGVIDLPAIREIFNEVILNSTALFEYEPRSLEAVRTWLEGKQTAGLPVLGCFDRTTLLGFASYVHANHRGRGVGRELLASLISQATAEGLHLMVAGIESSNRSSIALHRRFGFTHAGTIREAGRKFDRWLNLDFYEKRLSDSEPQQPR
jgi:L-amino acid N-acyltransferase YncA